MYFTKIWCIISELLSTIGFHQAVDSSGHMVNFTRAIRINNHKQDENYENIKKSQQKKLF